MRFGLPRGEVAEAVVAGADEVVDRGKGCRQRRVVPSDLGQDGLGGVAPEDVLSRVVGAVDDASEDPRGGDGVGVVLGEPVEGLLGVAGGAGEVDGLFESG